VPQTKALCSPHSFGFLRCSTYLAGELVFPEGRILSLRRTPFLFSTGLGQQGILPEFSRYPVLTKTFALRAFKGAIIYALSLRR
jgi:hypothetical protein